LNLSVEVAPFESKENKVDNRKRLIGSLVTWLPARAFGFVHLSDEAGEVHSYFLHLSQVASGVPVAGAEVEFTPIEGKKGPAARNAKILAEVK
jgi:cold shock CspA family protein